MRIAIFGATGAVGSTLLVHMLKGAELHAGDELILVGRGNPASTARLHAMRADLLDAFDAGIVTLKVCPSLETLGSLDLFVMAAGATIDGKIKRRSDLAGRNAPLFHDVALRVSKQCPNAFVLVISNPIELAVSIFAKYVSRTRVLGMGAQQDSLRFARAIAGHLQIPRAAVRASVGGEHGEGMVPLWSSVYVVDDHGEMTSRLDSLRAEYATDSVNTGSIQSLQLQIEALLQSCEVERAYLLLQSVSPDVKIQIEPYITVRVLHSTPNATANATLDCIAAIRYADDRRVHGQVLLNGEFYGMTGVLGVPLSLRRAGWRLGFFEPLTEVEVSRLRGVCEAVSRSYSGL